MATDTNLIDFLEARTVRQQVSSDKFQIAKDCWASIVREIKTGSHTDIDWSQLAFIALYLDNHLGIFSRATFQAMQAELKAWYEQHATDQLRQVYDELNGDE